MPKALPHRQRRGVSLVASLIVIVIIVIALFPLLRALSVSLFVSSENESTMTAANLLQSKMEEVRTVQFYYITSEAKAQITDHPTFQSEVIVSTPQTFLKKIATIIYWEDSSGIESSVSAETYAADF